MKLNYTYKKLHATYDCGAKPNETKRGGVIAKQHQTNKKGKLRVFAYFRLRQLRSPWQNTTYTALSSALQYTQQLEGPRLHNILLVIRSRSMKIISTICLSKYGTQNNSCPLLLF
jgi:hypothetical protein